jgi:hypothetical protein
MKTVTEGIHDGVPLLHRDRCPRGRVARAEEMCSRGGFLSQKYR